MVHEAIPAQDGWLASVVVDTTKSSQEYKLPIAAWQPGDLGEPLVVGLGLYQGAKDTHPWPRLVRLRDWRPPNVQPDNLKKIRVHKIERAVGPGSMGSTMFFGSGADPGIVTYDDDSGA